jgi:SAM-dependent methyltransferase
MSSRWQRTEAPRGDEYDARWAQLEARGEDPHGEAGFVCRFAPATVLDAGCGTGRVAIELDRRGVRTLGVDLDPGMLATARRKAPHLQWLEADLTELDVHDESDRRRFDVIVLAGNVMIFLEPGTEAEAVRRLADHLEPGGRIVAGFQLGSRLTLAGYDESCVAADLTLESRFATWQGDPFTPPGTYAVSVHRRAVRP